MFNTGQFILEVKKRPCLWNVKDSTNSDRQQKLKAYQEIAQLLNASNHSYSFANKNITVNDLQRKWKHLRDYYTREKKRGVKFRDNDVESDTIDSKSSSSARRKRKSPLLDMLQFLDVNRGLELVELTIEQLSADENCSLEVKEEDVKALTEQESPSPGKKQKMNKETQLNRLNEDTEDCSEKQFLSSLLPIIKKMSTLEKYNFQSHVMNSVAKSIGKYNTTATSMSEEVIQCSTISHEEFPSFGNNEEGNKMTAEVLKHRTPQKSQDMEEENRPAIISKVIPKRDEFTIYGEYVANKLRNIENSQARHTAEYHINGILYKAEMGEYDKVPRNTTKNGGKEQTSISDTTDAKSIGSRENLTEETEELDGNTIPLTIVKSEVIQLE